MRFPTLAAATVAGLVSLGCSDVGGLAPAATESFGSPIAHESAPNMSSAATALTVSNLVVQTGNAYSVSAAGIDVGARLYIDHAYTARAPLPDALKGLTYIRTANADRDVRPANDTLFSFTVSQAAIVYVAHDDRLSRPVWLRTGFTDTGLDIGSTDGNKRFSVFQRAVPAGVVALGGNVSKPRRGADMYFVLVRADAPAGEPAPELPPPEVPDSADPVFAITNVVASSGKAYALAAGMAVGAPLYVDREYAAQSPLPAALQDLTYIRTANDDKDLMPADGALLSFEVSQPALVSVAHDDLIQRPSWLTSGFKDSGIDLVSSDGNKTLSVFEKAVGAGQVVLGPNVTSPANHSMYVVFVRPYAIAPTEPLPDTVLSPAPEPEPEPEPLPVASVTVTPGTATLAVEESRGLTAVARDASGAVVSGAVVSWQSGSPGVVAVSATGVATALAAGTATVTATSGGQSGAAVLTVSAPAGEDPGHAGYYVAPGGSSGGDGSSARPWDLATALGRTLRGGDTLWLRGGTYRGRFTSRLLGTSTAPIVVRQYPGERATLDGQLVVNGGYTTFWGFEVMSSVSAPGDVEGISVHAPGTRLINLVVHDHGGNGVGTWDDAPNSEVYGLVIYNNGRQRVIPGFAHGIYGQNATGTKLIRDNIVFNQFGYGLHLYAEAGGLRGLHVEGNVTFQNGTPASARGTPNLELGGGTAASGAKILGNVVYKTSTEGTNLYLGYSAQNEDLEARDNYVVGGSPALRVKRWTRATVSNNTLIGSAEMVNVEGSRSGFSWSGNKVYRTPSGASASAWAVDGDVYNFSLWKSYSGLGSSDAVSSTRPTGTHVVVRPNRYEKGRANVTIVNWAGQANVSASLSGVLAVGQRYEVRNVQNFFGTPVASGTYGGGSISLPMTSVAHPRPVGGSIATLQSTGTLFHTFAVIPK
jgi:hypothetical protein